MVRKGEEVKKQKVATDSSFRLATDRCQLFVCPFDCASTLLPNETCPKCFCQPGERCPFVFCPTEFHCVQEMNAKGCMYCICRQGIYETYNKRKHLTSYVSKPLGNSVKEACSRVDAERVQRCASNFTILLESEMQLNQHLATTPEIASFVIPVICQRLSDRMRSFETHYMCTRNVLSAHADSTYCLDRFRHEV
ncbi:hypothetical protein TTRE_0000984101, partial [Trichuris trichiura]